MAREIAEDYKDETPLFVGVLNGAFMFVADFLKAYQHPCEVSFVRLSSYQGLTSTGIVETLLDVPEDIEGKSVIILEDVVVQQSYCTKYHNVNMIVLLYELHNPAYVLGCCIL